MIPTPVNRQFVHPPRHGLKAESVTSVTPGEKNKTSLLTFLKVANRSGSVAQTLSRGCGHRRGSEASPSGDSNGRSPWRAFGDFPRDGKVTRVQGGAPAGGCRDCRPAKVPGVGRVGPPVGLWGHSPHLGECRGAQPLSTSGGTLRGRLTPPQSGEADCTSPSAPRGRGRRS